MTRADALDAAWDLLVRKHAAMQAGDSDLWVELRDKQYAMEALADTLPEIAP